MGMLHGTRRALWGAGGYVYPFSLDDVTFTPGMAKRVGEAGVFDAAPIIQGMADSTAGSDALTVARGGQVIDDYFYQTLDTNQGSVVLWITPEWDGDDGLDHAIWRNGSSYPVLRKSSSDTLDFSLAFGTTVVVDISTWTAGTTYCVVARWDTKATIDGTNKVCISVNNVHTFGSTGGNVSDVQPVQRIGTRFDASGISSGNAIIEGLTVYRRVLYDGTYGTPPVDGADELGAIWAASVGKDPCQVTGSWDVTFMLCTDSSPGALV